MNTEQLVRQALTTAQDDPDPLLRQAAADGAAALPLAVALAASTDPAERIAACALLGHAADQDNGLSVAAATALLAVAADERDPEVLAEAVWALGQTCDPRATTVLCVLAAHPDTDVRLQTATALGSCPPAEPVVGALIALTRDREPEVRNWATFTLGFQIEADSPVVREALRARLTDGHADTREEAVRGLARRRDPDAVPLMVDLLRSEDGAHVLTFTAARILAAPELLPALRQYDPEDIGVADTVAACDPAHQDRLAATAWQLLTALDALHPDLGAALTMNRLDEGLTIEVADAPYDVGALLARAGQDPDRAVELVSEDLATA